tara:strand:+ start:70 stop:1038 length:969 start_codon:yes stop_codon:yes gene_type:complete
MRKENIPTIDISDLVKNGLRSSKSLGVIKKIKAACLKIGFFSVIGHGVSSELINSALVSSKNFFNLSKEKKMKIASQKWNKKNSNIYRGYFPSTVNGKEGLDMGDPNLKNSMHKIIRKDKFECLNLKEVLDYNSVNYINKYFDSLFNLGSLLFKSIMKSFDVNPNLSYKAFSRPKTLSTLRFNYYPKQKKPVEISRQDNKKLGCETHVDSGIITVLYQEKSGLQVQNRKDLKWHSVPHLKNSFVINTGLALQHLTNNKIKAANHRVLMNYNERISIPFFFEPNYDFQLNPTFLKIAEKPLYEVNNYEIFLNQSLSKFVEYRR